MNIPEIIIVTRGDLSSLVTLLLFSIYTDLCLFLYSVAVDKVCVGLRNLNYILVNKSLKINLKAKFLNICGLKNFSALKYKDLESHSSVFVFVCDIKTFRVF